MSGNFLVAVTGANDISSSFCVLFEDKLTGNITDFRADSSYTFYLTDTTSAPRFALHLLKNDSISCMEHISILTDDKEVSSSQDQIFVITKNNGLDVYFDLSENANAAVALYNLLGQNVIEEKNYAVRKTTIHLNLRNTAQAVYFLSVTTPNQKFIQKVFLR